MATLIQIRRDSQASWISNDPVLALGELAYSTDVSKLKAGNGSSLWSELPYINVLPSEIDNLDSDSISEGASNLYFTDSRALNAVQSSYESYTDQAETDAITAASADATTKADAAQSAAETYTNDLIGDATVDGTGGNTVTNRIDSAVSSLVSSAPETLDTLSELASALGDDPDFATTVANEIGTKVSKSGATMTGDLSLAQDPTQNLHAATKQYVDTAESSSNSFTTNEINALDTDDISEGTLNFYFTEFRAQQATPGRISASTTKPSSPLIGDGWLDVESGFLYVYINDGNSVQWIQA